MARFHRIHRASPPTSEASSRRSKARALLAALGGAAMAQRARLAVLRRGARGRTRERRGVSTLVLLRHGTSEWNGAEARFSGWSDVPLTVRGRVEAVAAGQLLRARGFPARRVDVAFTSELQRAHETCELALASMAGHCQHTWSTDRIQRDRRLNERHYGALQGHFKDDPELVAGFGIPKLREWKRSMHGTPPALDERHAHYQPPPAPLTESLADVRAEILSSVTSKSIRLIFGRTDGSHRVLEARPKSLRRNRRIRAH